MPLLAVTGLAAEARIAARVGLAVRCLAGTPLTELPLNTTGLVSFGIAGGLDPSLVPGVLILAVAVLGPKGGRFATAEDWRCRLAAALAGTGRAVFHGDSLGGTAIAATACEKARLFAATGAVAIDLESLEAARAARRFGLPFLVLRAVADPAGRNLPPAALLPLSPGGRPNLPQVAASLIAAPRQFPSLLRLAGETRRALAALAAAAPILAATPPDCASATPFPACGRGQAEGDWRTSTSPHPGPLPQAGEGEV